MYETFYGLDRRPFASAPNPDCFVPVDATQKSLAELIRNVQTGTGIGVLTGPAGLGKSLVARKLAREICEQLATITIPSVNFPTRRALLQAILYQLDRPYRRMDEQELRLELTTAIHDFTRDYEAIAMIFDEAHLLSARLLEEIRSMTNLVEDGRSLVRVTLIGQLSLEEHLAEPELASFNERIGCQVVLTPLSNRESADYVRKRVEYAGAKRELFSPEALQAICQASDGSPRCLNQLADQSLMLAYLAGEEKVGQARVHEALRDLQKLPLHWNVSSAVLDPLEQLHAEARRVRERSAEMPTTADIADLKRVETKSTAAKAEVIEIGSSDAVASFEIGAEEPVAPKTPDPVEMLRKLAKPTIPPDSKPMLLATRLGQAAKFDEELVVDRYARLDAGAPSSAKRNFMQRPPKALDAVPAAAKQPAKSGGRPTADELDQRIEGLMLLIDEALDAPPGDVAPMSVVTTGSRKEIAVSVDVDPVHGVRVQADGLLSALDTELNGKRTTFDVVLPEDESNAALESEKPHRPYEQLFSELRRRKGA